MRIVFMGTPDFAVASLKRLIEDGHQILAVYTQPDKPKNRGMKLIPTPVKALALEHDLPVYQPLSVRDEAVLAEIRAMAPEILVVAAYGKILPKELLEIPSIAAINVHSSLLPKYRGAAPINWAILNGDEETGVTIQHLGVELDAGDIITVRRTPIDPEEDASQLYDRLALLGAEALSEAVTALGNGTAQRIPQGEAVGEYAAMLSKDMSPIDWNKSAASIVNQVRGLIPWPCATTQLQGEQVKIYRAAVGEATGKEAGTVVSADKRGIAIAAGDGKTVVIKELQRSGSKRMAAGDYLLGRPIKC